MPPHGERHGSEVNLPGLVGVLHHVVRLYPSEVSILLHDNDAEKGRHVSDTMVEISPEINIQL